MARKQQESTTLWWRTPFTALLTIPVSLALGLALLAVAAVLAENWLGTPAWLAPLEREAVFSILTVVATAAMTALTLAYSLTLVVFTLAASSIGPRLLKRFTTERINQVTAGLLGGTFLYAIISLGLSDMILPRIATAGGGFLAVVSVIQLIWFVRSVAQSVSVDDELANIAARLEQDLHRLQSNRKRDVTLPDADSYQTAAETTQAGYLEQFDRQDLLKIAITEDVVLRIEHAPGTYLLKDTAVISVCGRMEEKTRDALSAFVHQEPARSDVDTVHFSLNLLIEIALRALSPGVNDTFTALAACDMLSGAMASVVDTDPHPEVLVDDDGKPRVVLPGASVRQLIDEAFHPLRRAAASNILMAEGLARSYQRLFDSGNEHSRAVLREHARILLSDLNRLEHDKADIDAVIAHMPTLVRSVGDLPSDKQRKDSEIKEHQG